MKMQNWNETMRRASGRVLAGAALVMTLGGVAQAAPSIESQPGNAPLAIVIPDTAKWWSKTAALPLVQGVQAFMKSPEMTADGDYQQFLLDVEKLEKELGFPLSNDEMWGNVFSSLEVVGVQETAGKEPHLSVRMGVKDEAKAGKILDLIEQKNPVLLEFGMKYMGENDSVTSGTSYNVEKLVLEKGRGFAMGNGETSSTVFVALAEGKLIMTDQMSLVHESVTGSEPVNKLADNENFKALKEKVDLGSADVQLYVDGDALAGDLPGELSMLKGMAQQSKNSKSLTVLNVEGNSVNATSAMPFDAATAAPNVKPGALKGLGLLGNQPLIGVSYGLTDLKQLYAQAAPMMMMMGGMGGGSPWSQFEAATSISLQNDLVPAIGRETLLGLNDLVPNPIPPFIPAKIDLITALEIGDEAKMNYVLERIEAYVKQMTAPMAGMQQPGAPAPETGFQTVKTQHGDIRSVQAGLPGLSPSYAKKNGFVVFGITKEAVEAAITGMDTNANAEAPFRKFAGEKETLVAGTVDVTGLVEKVIAPYLPLAAQQNPEEAKVAMSFLTTVLTHAGVMNSAANIEGQTLVTRVKLDMKP